MQNYTEELPIILDVPLIMSSPNETITIHEGTFMLKEGDNLYEVTGKVEFRWLPEPRVIFNGKASITDDQVLSIGLEPHTFDLLIDNDKFGNCSITFITTGNDEYPSQISGKMNAYPVKGDTSIAVASAQFIIPNFLRLNGISVKNKGEKFHIQHSRLIFETQHSTITIDKEFNYDELQRLLKDRGGYIMQYRGEIKSKKGNFRINEIQNTLDCFSSFLSFMNGRKTCTMFLHAIHESELKWVDYSYKSIDPYSYVFKWPEERHTKQLNDIWNEFYKISQDDDDKFFLESAVRWYVGVNSTSGGIYGSIVMAQAALELIYNWLIIEKNKLLISKDAESISASNKLRLLLSFIKAEPNIPPALEALRAYQESNKQKIVDGPEAVVHIRNAIVHSQAVKRKDLSSIDPKALDDALQLSIWYIELSLLFILGFNDIYLNRCSTGNFAAEKESLVPWTNKNQHHG